MVSWLDPLTWDNSVDAPRYGANNDYIAYFGDGWDADSLSPIYRGSDNEGWVWSNHEYVSNDAPTLVSAPAGQHLTMARFLQEHGVLTNDITAESGAKKMSIPTFPTLNVRSAAPGCVSSKTQHPVNGLWITARDNQRYDGSNQTLLTVTGQTLSAQAEVRETDIPSEEEVVEEEEESERPVKKKWKFHLPCCLKALCWLMGDCSGGQTPWGTILTGEENVQSYYGDLEAGWTSSNAFIPESGFDAGAPISPIFESSETAAFGATSDPAGRHNRDFFGYVSEIDPGVPSNDYYESVSDEGDGMGHRKIGSMGRARWENAAIVVNKDWELTPYNQSSSMAAMIDGVVVSINLSAADSYARHEP